MTDISQRAARHALWRVGALSAYLFHVGQIALHNAFLASQARIFVAVCARRWGKSLFCCAMAIMAALSKAEAQIRYAAPTAKMVRSIIEPHMRRICADAPPELRPEHNRTASVWRFPNGSEIHVAGCDGGGADRLRGVSTDLGIVDEAGFVADLAYVVQDVLLPQTLTCGGRIILPSTPPHTPGHDFAGYAERAEAAGAYYHATIHDAPHITPELVDEYARESGGRDHSTFRREYMAQFVVDAELAVLPEFSREERHVVMDFDRPEHADWYVAMDVGFYDQTFAVFGFLDFETATLRIWDELSLQRATSADIAMAVAAKEAELGITPHRRVVDAPAITVADLNRSGDGRWALARKDDRFAALNHLRRHIADHRVLVHPRCRQLIAHMRHAIWNKARTQYERSADHGHFDGVDAVKYLLRAVSWNRDPRPVVTPDPQTHMIPRKVDRTKQSRLARAFRGRRR